LIDDVYLKLDLAIRDVFDDRGDRLKRTTLQRAHRHRLGLTREWML